MEVSWQGEMKVVQYSTLFVARNQECGGVFAEHGIRQKHVQELGNISHFLLEDGAVHNEHNGSGESCLSTHMVKLAIEGFGMGSSFAVWGEHLFSSNISSLDLLLIDETETPTPKEWFKTKTFKVNFSCPVFLDPLYILTEICQWH